MLRKTFAAGSVLLTLAAGAALAQQKGGKKGPAGPGLTLTSPDFEDGSIIPNKYTQASSMPVSPELKWTNVPAGTMSFTLILHDPDAAPGKNSEDVLHWLIFDIPGTATGLTGNQPTEEKTPDGAVQAKNRAGRVGFLGPGAGAAGPYHHYTFELYALDDKVSLGPDATRAEVLKAMDGHILGKAVLVGRFHR